MFILLTIALLVAFGIYYVTTLDFKIGSGFSEDKSHAKDVDYTENEVPSEKIKKVGE